MCNAVFCQHSKAVAVYHFGDTVIYFGVNVIRSAGKNDALLALFLEHLKHFFAL